MPRPLVCLSCLLLTLLLLPVGPPLLAQTPEEPAPAETPAETPAENPAELPAEAIPQAEPKPVTRWVYREAQISIFGDVMVLPNEHVQDQIVCVGGEVVVDGFVEGQIVVVGGSLRLSGTVDGQVIAVLSDVTLEEGAVIEDQFVAVGGPIDDRGAQINSGGNVRIRLPYPLLGKGRPFAAVSSFVTWVKAGKLLLIFLVVVLLVALTPRRVATISDEAASNFFLAILVGLIARIVIVLLYTVLLVSVIGWPFVPVLFVAEIYLRALGRAGLFHLLGTQFGRSMNREMSMLGAVCLGFLPYALLTVLPFLFGLWGFFFGLFTSALLVLGVEWPALGLALMTRGGGRRHGEARPVTPAVPDPAPVETT